MTRVVLHFLGCAPEDAKRVVIDVDAPPAKIAEQLMADVRRWRLQRSDGRITIINPSRCAWLDLEALVPDPAPADSARPTAP